MPDGMREQVRERYAEAARRAGSGSEEASCCGSGTAGAASDTSGAASALEVDLSCGGYSTEELGQLPQAAASASLGCGNPVALATLSPGEVVLDLGSGGGIDVLLSAKRVSPGGKAYGVDMTDEMLELARKNQLEAGAENVEFLKGSIEELPLPEGHVDVIISNCVINLSTEKSRVLEEAFRVLKPGGRFAVSDVVFLGDRQRLPSELLATVGLWTGCIAGALSKDEYEGMLADAGFEEVSVEVTNTYDPASIEGLDERHRRLLEEIPVASAFVRATKPGDG
jgi:SAM-dependent methyltransferase